MRHSAEEIQKRQAELGIEEIVRMFDRNLTYILIDTPESNYQSRHLINHYKAYLSQKKIEFNPFTALPGFMNYVYNRGAKLKEMDINCRLFPDSEPSSTTLYLEVSSTCPTPPHHLIY
ncbi:MAG: hypothetical protein ABH840_02135 [Nanoarchaeota archaeon]